MSIADVAARITISVIDENSAQTVKAVADNLSAMGAAGQAGGAAAAAGLDQVGEHALTSLDNVRLLRDDLGIRIPRSMEKAIASSELLSGAIGAVGSGLLAVGAVEIIAHMGEEIYNAYEKYLDINAAAKDFQATVEKNQQADFINVRSIEDARLRIDDVISAASRFQSLAESLNSRGWSDIGAGLASAALGQGTMLGSGFDELYGSSQLADEATKLKEQGDDLDPKKVELQHQLTLAQIDAQHATDESLQGQAKITAELEKQLAIHKEDQKYTRLQDRLQGNFTSPTSGAELQSAQDAIAQGAASAQRIELQRQETNAIISLQNEARDAGLTGDALIAAQEQQEIDAVTRKYQQGEIDKQTAKAETDAIEQKFFAQAMERQQQLDEATQRMVDEASQAGLTGVAKIQAQLKTQMDAISAAEQKTVGPGGQETPEQWTDYQEQREAAEKKANADIAEQRQQFNNRLDELDSQDADFMLSGYARIEAETQKHIAAMEKDYQEFYGQLPAWDKASVDARLNLVADELEVEESADRQRAQLHQQTMKELTTEEQQAARDMLPAWQAAQLNIIDQYNNRVQQATQALNKELAANNQTAQQLEQVWSEYYAQIAVAAAVEQAALEKQAMETRDKVASSLQELFKDPAGTIEKDAENLMFKILANWLMQSKLFTGQFGGVLQQILGLGPDVPTTGSMQSQLGTVFGGSQGGATTLTSAGTQLTAAGTGLNSAAAALMNAASSLSMGGGGGIGGIGGGLGGLGAGAGGSGTGDDLALPDNSTLFGVDSDNPFAGVGSDISDVSSDATAGAGTSGQVAAQAAGLGGAGSKWLGVAGGAIAGGIGLYNAYENSDPIGGALTGAMAGAEIGSFFGPEGTAIGAIAGGIAGIFAGLFGDKGKGKAESYDKNTVQPEITKDMDDYDAGRTGYNQVAKDLNSLMTSAQSQTASWGSGARDWFSSHISPEISAALTSLNKQEAAGRGQITMSAAEYHTGGWVGDFGDFQTSPNEGLIHAMAGEYVVHPMAAAAHGPLLNAMNSGSRFSFAPQGPSMAPSSSGGASVSLTIQAIDAQSVKQWMARGGARAITAGLNQGQKQYSGKGRGY